MITDPMALGDEGTFSYSITDVPNPAVRLPALDPTETRYKRITDDVPNDRRYVEEFVLSHRPGGQGVAGPQTRFNLVVNTQVHIISENEHIDSYSGVIGITYNDASDPVRLDGRVQMLTDIFLRNGSARFMAGER